MSEGYYFWRVEALDKKSKKAIISEHTGVEGEDGAKYEEYYFVSKLAEDGNGIKEWSLLKAPGAPTTNEGIVRAYIAIGFLEGDSVFSENKFSDFPSLVDTLHKALNS